MEAQDKFGPTNPHLLQHGQNPGSSSSPPASDEVTFAHNETPSWHAHAEHGAPIDNVRTFDQAEDEYQHQRHLFWSRARHAFRDPFMEFCGTMIMIVFGDGSVAQVLLSANPNLPQSSQNKGDYQSISWGYVYLSLFSPNPLYSNTQHHPSHTPY
jgi:hypothetical protein